MVCATGRLAEEQLERRSAPSVGDGAAGRVHDDDPDGVASRHAPDIVQVGNDGVYEHIEPLGSGRAARRPVRRQERRDLVARRQRHDHAGAVEAVREGTVPLGPAMVRSPEHAHANGLWCGVGVHSPCWASA